MTMFSTFFSISIVGFEQVNVCWVNAFLTLATKALVDDDDDDDDELFLWYGWPTKGVALFPAGTTVRDPHHRESPTRREQDLNLRRAWVQAL